MAFPFPVFLVLYLVCLTTRTSYELFKKRGLVITGSTMLFAAIFTVMCLMWVCWFSMCPLDPWRLDVPRLARWIDLSAFTVGWGLAIGALIQLRGLEDIDHLVTTGLFSRLRHPMYTGFILWILGWAMYHGAALSLGAGVNWHRECPLLAATRGHGARIALW
jgi:protein-S-isoprenylcysteine O-methyltransferase Ste14